MVSFLAVLRPLGVFQPLVTCSGGWRRNCPNVALCAPGAALTHIAKKPGTAPPLEQRRITCLLPNLQRSVWCLAYGKCSLNAE